MVTKKATQRVAFFYLCNKKGELLHKFMNQ